MVCEISSNAAAEVNAPCDKERDASDTAAQILTETGVEAVSYSEVARAVVEVEFNTSKGGE